MTRAVKVQKNATDRSWTIESPGGDKLDIGSDFSKNGPDITMTFDATQFLLSGLDYGKLPKEYTYDWNRKTLTISFDLGSNALPPGSDGSVTDTFKGIVSVYRKNIGYAAELDLFGILLGNGNSFDWAKDMSSNDKDMVFILNPEPLIKAGLDPYRPEGWVFTKVTAKGKNGGEIKIDKLIKAYNLR
jgi:hypothetical protein